MLSQNKLEISFKLVLFVAFLLKSISPISPISLTNLL